MWADDIKTELNSLCLEADKERHPHIKRVTHEQALSPPWTGTSQTSVLDPIAN